MKRLTSLGSGEGVSGWPGPHQGVLSVSISSQVGISPQTKSHLLTISHPLGQDSETGLMLIQGAAVLSHLQSGTPSCELLNSGLGARNALSVHGSHNLSIGIVKFT